MGFLDWIPVVGDVVSAVGNIAGVSSTNRANKEIAHLNNEFNERMLQKQMDYNTDMWNKENEYNSASNQRQRLEDAGLNPYLMMNGASAGTAGSVGGVNPPTATPVTMQAPNIPQFGSSIYQAMALQEQKRMNDSNIDHVNADADLKRMQQMTTLMDAISNSKNKNAQTKLFRALESTERQMLGVRWRRENEEANNAFKNGLLLSKELSIFDDKSKVMLSNQIADTLLKTEHMKMSKQERIHEIQKMIKTTAETQGIKISNDIARRSANSIVDRAYKDAVSGFGLQDIIGAGIMGAWHQSGRGKR